MEDCKKCSQTTENCECHISDEIKHKGLHDFCKSLMSNIETDFYKKYVGQWAKRFYNSFEKERMVKISGFKMIKGEAYLQVTDESATWTWDMDDCVIITNELPIVDDERIANIHHKEYKGYNPFS